MAGQHQRGLQKNGLDYCTVKQNCYGEKKLATSFVKTARACIRIPTPDIKLNLIVDYSKTFDRVYHVILIKKFKRLDTLDAIIKVGKKPLD